MSETNSNHRKCELLLDTSALLLVAEGVNPIEESLEVLRSRCSSIRLVLLAKVTQELNRLASNKGRRGVAARLALTEVGRLGVETVDIVNCDEADDCILKYSLITKNLEVIVLTADRELARTLREYGVRHIVWWRSRRKFILR